MAIGTTHCAVRRKALHLLHCIRGEGAILCSGQQRIGQVAPQKCGMILHGRVQHRIARQDRHRARAKEPPIPLTIACAACLAITIHIQPRGASGIGGQRETMGVDGTPCAKHICESTKRGPVEVIVDALQHDDIGRDIRQQTHHGADLWVRPFGQIPQQQTWSVAR